VTQRPSRQRGFVPGQSPARRHSMQSTWLTHRLFSPHTSLRLGQLVLPLQRVLLEGTAKHCPLASPQRNPKLQSDSTVQNSRHVRASTPTWAAAPFAAPSPTMPAAKPLTAARRVR